MYKNSVSDRNYDNMQLSSVSTRNATYHMTNSSVSLPTSCVACVKLEHVLFLLRGMFWTFLCVRKAGNRAIDLQIYMPTNTHTPPHVHISHLIYMPKTESESFT